MSNSRQRSKDSALVRTFGLTFHSAQRLSYPAPGWDQLVYATASGLTVRTGPDCWVLAAWRALWIPAGTPHEIEASRGAELRSLYFRARAASALPRECCAVNVTALLRELILHTIGLGALDRSIPRHRRLAGVLMDQMRVLPEAPLQLPLPRDPRAERAAKMILDDPPGAGMTAVARRSGASVRTLERLFRSETGMSAGEWIRRARLLRALQSLAAGRSVAEVAEECGYRGASAFVAMFRRELGSTPGGYFRSTGAEDGADPVAFKRKNG